MRLVKIAVSAPGHRRAVRSNVDTAIRLAGVAGADGVTLGVFHEQLVGGYPAETWCSGHVHRGPAHGAPALRRRDRRARHGVRHRRRRGPRRAPLHLRRRGAPRRRAGAGAQGEAPDLQRFYERRTFSAGQPYQVGQLWDGVPFGDVLLRFDWGVLGVEVCEDGWSPDGPMRRRVYSGAEVVANVSASPYRVGSRPPGAR